MQIHSYRQVADWRSALARTIFTQKYHVPSITWTMWEHPDHPYYLSCTKGHAETESGAAVALGSASSGEILTDVTR
jgi:hypothetical protein